MRKHVRELSINRRGYPGFVLWYIPCQVDDETTKYEARVDDKRLEPSSPTVDKENNEPNQENH